MLGEEARRKELMKNFFTAWGKSGNQLDAARETFGDMKQFGRRIESYARQGSFRIGVVKAGQQAADKSYTVRSVAPGEVIAVPGDFLTHHNPIEQAQPCLAQPFNTDP